MDEALRLAREGDWSLDSWLPLAQEALGQRLTNRKTAQKAFRESEHLVRTLTAKGATTFDLVTQEMVTEWCWASRPDHRTGKHKKPQPATARNRQWHAKQVFVELANLGAPVDPSALIGESIKRPPHAAQSRPLEPPEWETVKAHADPDHRLSRCSVIVAFAHAGGNASEIANVRKRDVDAAEGTVTFSGLAARTNPLCDWGRDVVRRWLHNHPHVSADERLCVLDHGDELRSAQTVTVRMQQVMERAGLAGVPKVTARSIRLAAGRRVLETDGIEAAALFLGSPSLDNAARSLNYRWWLRDGQEVA